MTALLMGFFAPWVIFAGIFGLHIVLPTRRVAGYVLYVVLFSWFVCDYLVFERVHLYTYDFFAERLGFKLVWGCLCLYPYFYMVGLWSVADRNGSRKLDSLFRGFKCSAALGLFE